MNTSVQNTIHTVILSLQDRNEQKKTNKKLLYVELDPPYHLTSNRKSTVTTDLGLNEVRRCWFLYQEQPQVHSQVDDVDDHREYPAHAKCSKMCSINITRIFEAHHQHLTSSARPVQQKPAFAREPASGPAAVGSAGRDSCHAGAAKLSKRYNSFDCDQLLIYEYEYITLYILVMQ